MSAEPPSRSKRWRRRLVVLGVSFVATVCLAELCATLFMTATNRERGVVFDEDWGWKHLANVRKVGPLWSDDEPSWTNSKGWRDEETEYERPRGKQRIVAVGDSFTFGVAVDYGERYTEILEQGIPNLDVVNLGVNAFGTDQEVLVLEREGFLYDPNIVVLMAFLGNDLTDILCDRKGYWPKPYFFFEDGELALVRPAETWDVKLRTSSYVGEGLFRIVQPMLASRHVPIDVPDALDLFEALIARAARSCAANDADFLVVVVYSRRKAFAEEPFERERAARARLEGTGVEVLDTWELFSERTRAGEDLYAPDGHWNEAGHALMGERLAERLRELEWVP